MPHITNCRDLFQRTPFVVDYWKCPVCGLVQQYPVPQDTTSFYSGYAIHVRRSKLHAAASKLVMGDVYYRPKPLKFDQILLDYGCGDGSYLESVAGRFTKRYGYEPDAAHARRLTDNLGLPVFSDLDALRTAGLEGQIDVVTMHFVLEHITDLDAAFAAVERLLKPGGAFYFVVPNVDSWEFRIFRQNWHGLDPPRHIGFPGRDPVGRLATRHGLTPVRSKYVAFPNGVAGSIATAILGRFCYPLFLCALPIGILASRIAPQGALAFWLRKTSRP